MVLEAAAVAVSLAMVVTSDARRVAIVLTSPECDPVLRQLRISREVAWSQEFEAQREVVWNVRTAMRITLAAT